MLANHPKFVPPRIFPSRFKCVPVYGISHANASAIEIRFAACRLVDPEPHARTRNRVKVNKKARIGMNFVIVLPAFWAGSPALRTRFARLRQLSGSKVEANWLPYAPPAKLLNF